ncbi:alpha-amylase/4-alpha-glucanotransferase domain-containing protein [Pyrococcus abyssi]|uniref:Alpha-amylase n=1 Tax=Pyrococcus abyssi (strain GE5 / Orsay) TaxID=272844 RepID=AMYA_PYRAB|nr:alpha-amylase/4-alpha-glucanotransferase domain-containing protein [Pyrococcus abyssi]Q9V298.1 RecName: Full=Alpha-amylase [Pyrococcus abyssi GE5]CAB49100.1 amyA alpha-amylase (or 4-alpha-glucanotransferase) [Pyrococcus abyssi GE5]CCE69552.1 TPA: Alpha-amylase (or 4-alpha-glucanotransferase) [Pyrococcus abyssi GE5]
MPRINFIFGIHNHQPLGNFGWVMEEAYEKAYRPFLEILEEYPNMKVAIHISGILVEWLEENKPDYIDLLKSLVRKGQVEIVVAGFYEPVLAAIPKEDRLEQIYLLKEWAKKIGYDAKGLWLTERVWQPELVKTLREAGIEYVVVDDYHFMSAGLSKDQLFWPYYTEDGGEVITVFPIDEKLRYLIPFRPVDKVISYLHSLASEDESKVAVFHDDGEKFGIWPMTYEWVYEKGWLREFFDRVSSDEAINIMLYSEYLQKFKPKGLVYLPIASYFEMSEWSLPAQQAKLFVEFVEKLKELNMFERYRVFVRGGIWKNFFYKYPEANYMHKRMLMLSRLLRDNPSARRFVLRAQCNDAYWHGVFGGIYLPHLRRAIWSNLIKAHSHLEPKNKILDVDFDGREEVFLENDNFIIVVKPHYGGSIFELSSKRRAVNYADVIARRWEHYHNLGESESDDNENQEGVSSIHEIGKRIPEDIRKELAYDRYRRGILQDHFFSANETLDRYRLAKYWELGDFIEGVYNYEVGNGLVLWRRGKVLNVTVDVKKSIEVREDGFSVRYTVLSEEDIEALFGIELNIAVHSIKESPEELIGKRIKVNDKYGVGEFEIVLNKKARIWKYPVKTLSQSEAGWDYIQQGVSYTIIYPINGRLDIELYFREL